MAKISASVSMTFGAQSKHGYRNKKDNQLPLLFCEPSNSCKDDFLRKEERIFSQKDSSSKFNVFESEKLPSRKLWQREKKRFENLLSIPSNLVNVINFKVHFFTFVKVLERYLFSLAFYGMFAINEIKNLKEKCQPFCWISLNFFNSFWCLGKFFSAGVSNLQSKCTMEHFEKSLCSTNKIFVLKNSSNFHQKISCF